MTDHSVYPSFLYLRHSRNSCPSTRSGPWGIGTSGRHPLECFRHKVLHDTTLPSSGSSSNREGLVVTFLTTQVSGVREMEEEFRKTDEWS